jgi:predicted DNA-binding WGR domain protein
LGKVERPQGWWRLPRPALRAHGEVVADCYARVRPPAALRDASLPPLSNDHLSSSVTGMRTRKFDRYKSGINDWWNITNRGKELVINWGREGTLGSSKRVAFSSGREADLKMSELVAAKVAEGFREFGRGVKRAAAAGVSVVKSAANATSGRGKPTKRSRESAKRRAKVAALREPPRQARTARATGSRVAPKRRTPSKGGSKKNKGDDAPGASSGRALPQVRAPTPIGPPPLDALKICPSLRSKRSVATLIRSARSGSLAPSASKIGGRFYWPEREPWPRCRRHNDFLVGVLQIARDDFPTLPFPSGSDIFQLLWCTHYEPRAEFHPKLLFRTVSAVPLLERIPAPNLRENVPRSCAIFPEKVQELPAFNRLSRQERLALEEVEGVYTGACSVGWSSKVGGHVAWIQDPQILLCTCGRRMQHYLTLASAQRKQGQERWGMERTGLWIRGSGALYVFVCRRCEPWRFRMAVQT